MASTVEPLNYRRPTPPPRHRRALLIAFFAAIVLVALIAAALVRAETKTTPYLKVHREVSRTVKLPGKKFTPAWPSEGEAAVAVEGVGNLGSTGGQTPEPIASVAKVMTAYLTLKQFPLEPGQEGFRVRITQAQVNEERERVALDQSTVAVRAGEVLSERQLLEALMLPSANNIAALLAVKDGGSIGGFVAKMNATAKELGMSKTHYTDPSGFEESTVSTASDQLKLARMAMQDKTFAAIVAKRSTVLPVVGRVLNYNELVGRDGYVGIKTGSDEAAGGCLVFAKRMTVDGHTFTVLGAVMGQHDGELVQAALASRRHAGRLGRRRGEVAGRDPGRDEGDDARKRRRRNGRGEDPAAAARGRLAGAENHRPPEHRQGSPQRRQGRTVGDPDGPRDERAAHADRGRREARRTGPQLALGTPAVAERLASPDPRLP